MYSCILVQLQAESYILVLSTNALQQLLAHSVKTLTKIVNGIGPSTLPCGIPPLPFGFYFALRASRSRRKYNDELLIWATKYSFCWVIMLNADQNNLISGQDRGVKKKEKKSTLTLNVFQSNLISRQDGTLNKKTPKSQEGHKRIPINNWTDCTYGFVSFRDIYSGGKTTNNTPPRACNTVRE